jgi:hypothetical protein
MKRTAIAGIGLASLLALPYAAYKSAPDAAPLHLREARAAQAVKVDSRSRLIRGLEVGEVLMDDKVVFRIRTGAGGMSAPERAEAVAGRLADMVNGGRLSANDVRLGYMNGQRVLTANGDLLITADQYHAQANGTTPTQLASAWQGNIVTALGGTVARNPGGNPGRYGAASVEDVRPDLRNKLVPILSAGTGLRIGMAQVTGPERDVNEVQGVAEVEVEWRRAARARVYVPISDLNVTRGINRVPRVGVSGLGDVRLKF